LGKGSFGEVWEVLKVEDQTRYAVKKKKKQYRGTSDR
jgi:hypothetical protein